jgi:N-acetylmuramate 1-kinase
MSASSPAAADPRLSLLEDWLAHVLKGAPLRLEPASADASFRRYFRVFAGGRTLVAMDAPPEREDCRPFIKVAALLREAGLNAPVVQAENLEQGFLLLTDLGTTTYLAALGAGDADCLMRDAIGALVRWQAASRPGVLPPYDEALMRRELELYPEWYVGRHLRRALVPAERAVLDAAFRRILEACLAQPQVYVHRDYMPRNLMVCDPNPGILDFQDAVYGPISYDIASLTRDAFISWEEERVIDWTVRYWERARKAGLPVHADFAEFWRDVEWMGLQRHLKVLGIFARINYRDAKPHYLADTPRFLGYVLGVARRYREFGALAALVEELEGERAQAGCTFQR